MRRRIVEIVESVLSFGLSLGLGAGLAFAEASSDFSARFEAEARASAPGFSGFDATRGRALYESRFGREWSCASCHGASPTGRGEHAVTGKPIDPLAPSANPARFTRADRVEKWFRRNCGEVLGRPCTAQEKGDLLAWLGTFSAKEGR